MSSKATLGDMLAAQERYGDDWPGAGGQALMAHRVLVREGKTDLSFDEWVDTIPLEGSVDFINEAVGAVPDGDESPTGPS